MTTTQKRIGLHILGWSFYIGYTILGYILNNWGFSTLMLKLSLDVLHLIQFYACYLLIFPQWVNNRNWFLLILGVAGVMLLFIVLRYCIEETLYPVLFGFGNYHPGTTLSYYLKDNVYWSLPGVFLGAVVWAFESAWQKERENRILRNEKTQAELSFLKTQINPHFLYNTLNYIYSLAYPVSDKLGNAIVKLSDLMRYMLNDSRDGKVELQMEVDYLHSYIDIYRLRYEENFFVNFDIQGNVKGQRVPSMVLIPFVENALKHGVVDDPAMPVQVSLRLFERVLYFEVSNGSKKQQKDHTTGIGLANIRRRLDLIYPDSYSLEIEEVNQCYCTKLKLKQL